MRLVIDSSAALRAASSAAAASDLSLHDLVGPPLLWSEVHSAVHEATWRRDIDDAQAAAILAAFARLGVRRRAPASLHGESFALATELGWAKTYDAEFLALARLERAVVLTTDQRLLRGGARTGLVVGPADLDR